MIKLLDLQHITAEHLKEYEDAIDRVVRSGWFLQGQETVSFEKEYANYIGTEYCIGVANGLDALKLILRGYKELGILNDGDEIIVPANTYIATIIAITENNLKPVLVEPTWENLEINTSKIESAITPLTKGIMTVHLYGRIAYDNTMKELCDKYNLLLLEDCAQSHGCEWEGIKTGALGNAAAHSFYPGKNLGAFGDAGAVTTNDKNLADIIRALANYGSQKKYIFKYTGLNSRISEIDAAILKTKLRYLNEDNRKRQQLATYYYENISNSLITLPKRLNDSNNVYHIFPIFCEERDRLQEYLTNNGVQTMIHYPIPPHKQECYKQWNSLSLPITEKIHRQELSIPINQVITNNEAEKIVSLLNSFR